MYSYPYNHHPDQGTDLSNIDLIRLVPQASPQSIPCHLEVTIVLASVIIDYPPVLELHMDVLLCPASVRFVHVVARTSVSLLTALYQSIE